MGDGAMEFARMTQGETVFRTWHMTTLCTRVAGLEGDVVGSIGENRRTAGVASGTGVLLIMPENA